jgi:osmotically-inducible protein OsmY
MLDDKQLKQAVLDELSWDPTVNAAHIGITAKDGVITLSGQVENYADKLDAEKAVRRVKGVKAIAEEMEVRLPFDVRHGDEEIAAAAIGRLKWDVSVPADAVKVKVEKGWITLTGEVDWHFQHDAAANDIRGLWGVVGVSNQITIKPVANAANIKESITTALNRSWFNPMKVDVAVQGGKVTLSGSVHGWSERDQAGATAWAAPGVTSVSNNIHVN